MEEEKIMLCLNYFRPYSKEAIQEKVDTLLIFHAFHYFSFFITSPKPIIRILQARGRERETLQGRGRQRLYGKKETSTLSKLICTWTLLIVFIFLRKIIKIRKQT